MTARRIAELSFRPLVTTWPKPETPVKQRRPQQWDFYRGINSWLDHLVKELDYLKVREAIVEIDAAPADFKRGGGGLFADTRTNSPKVLVTFDLPDVGTVRYPCDTYRSWQENLHAIGLTLERLRQVDSYGATTGREQYRGFKALPGAGETGTERELTPEEAASALVDRDPTWADMPAMNRLTIAQSLLTNKLFAAQVARNAVKATHPDAGGDAVRFGQVQRARAALSKHFGEDV